MRRVELHAPFWYNLGYDAFWQGAMGENLGKMLVKVPPDPEGDRG